MNRFTVLSTLLACSALAGEKPAFTYKAPPAGDDERPVIVEAVVSPQGSDYAFKLEFNKEPWGDGCKQRCANATLFLDLDGSKATGLKLKDAKADETGADLAITIQGTRDVKEGVAVPGLRVKVVQYAEDATAVDQGTTLMELDQRRDPERVLAQGSSVYLLVDANAGNLPSGARMRVIYHPPDTKALVGTAVGLAAPSSARVELFKDGKLTNPSKPKKKSAYEKY